MNEYTLHAVQDDHFLEFDKTLATPDIGYEPHLLISRVRKQYLEYITKLLTVNYENYQRLINKNIASPSAIRRCAKNIEMTVASKCMIVRLYRKKIYTVIRELKHDTEKGILYRNLHDCVNKPPEYKEVQTSITKTSDCTCQCVCNQRKKQCKDSSSPKECRTIFGSQIQDNTTEKLPSEPPPKLPVQAPEPDTLAIQMANIFQEDCNDDDLFERSISYTPNSVIQQVNINSSQGENTVITAVSNEQNIPLESLKQQSNGESYRSNAVNHEKKVRWLCEEYFLKSKLFELQDELRENNRTKLSRIKELLIDLFGDDSDDEGVMSPMDDSYEFRKSCIDRITPMVVRAMNPFYFKGLITEKNLFKSLAKYLVQRIHRCIQYPNELQVKSYVNEFFKNRKKITCEADYLEFSIDENEWKTKGFE